MTVRKVATASAFAIIAATQVATAEDKPNLGDLTLGDPFFYTSDQDITADDGQAAMLGTGRPGRTHSGIPHLPAYIGYMNTNYTYRFVTIAEQVLTMIGEGKHGLWRVHESGTIREYLRPGATGLPEGADVMAPENQDVLAQSYAAFIPEAGWDGYRYPDQKVDAEGRLTFVDLPITHPKYGTRYADHDPIDLPSFYCTMSENDFPYAWQAMRFAFAQPAAGQIGPLGKRAGLDIRENYTSVLRLTHFPDARSWVNVGQAGEDALHVNWLPVDTTKTSAEYYLVERPFFNKPYLFVMAVFDNADNDDLRYVRPQGPYWDALGSRAEGLKTEVSVAPRFHLETGDVGKAVGLPLYGVHHPNRNAFKAGGACPLKGGDWGRYPDPSGGSGWPTQYEEVTPLCDAVLVDIKFYANLDAGDWNDPQKYLANAGTGSKTVTYKVAPGEYGTFTDPYNVARGAVNPQAASVPPELTVTYASVQPPVKYTVPPPDPDDQRVAVMLPTPSTSCRPIPG